MYETIISMFVSYMCQTWSATVRERAYIGDVWEQGAKQNIQTWEREKMMREYLSFMHTIYAVLGLFFHPEDGRTSFLQNFGNCLQECHILGNSDLTCVCSKYQWSAFVFYVSLLQNKFYVVDKLTGQVLPIKYKSKKAFFLFHHINTYEEAGQVYIDIHWVL
jgi:hypothetical protein